MVCCHPGTASSGDLDQIPVGTGRGFASARMVLCFCIGIPCQNLPQTYSITRQILWTVLIYCVVWAGDNVLWLCVPQDCLTDFFYLGVLDVAGVRFDVSGMDLLCDVDLVWYIPSSMMSDATGMETGVP